MSIASRRQSSRVWRTSRWSGISIGPGATFSWQAASVGNTAAIRSSDSIRWIAGGFFRPPRHRSTASEVFRFQRQRAGNSGAVSTACRTTSSTVPDARNFGTRSSGKLCCGPSDSRIALSLAAACSSKSNVTQNRLRSASPRARFSRAPNGACPTSCIPPASSKKRSSTIVSIVGSSPSWASPAPRYAAIVSAAASPSPHSAASQLTAAGAPPAASWPATADLIAQTSCDSSTVRPGASPSQNGTDGGAPCASTTRTTPGSTRRIRHEVVPSRNTSPAMLSIAQSSLTEPTTASSGSATTR